MPKELRKELKDSQLVFVPGDDCNDCYYGGFPCRKEEGADSCAALQTLGYPRIFKKTADPGGNARYRRTTMRSNECVGCQGKGPHGVFTICERCADTDKVAKSLSTASCDLAAFIESVCWGNTIWWVPSNSKETYVVKGVGNNETTGQDSRPMVRYINTDDVFKTKPRERYMDAQEFMKTFSRLGTL